MTEAMKLKGGMDEREFRSYFFNSIVPLFPDAEDVTGKRVIIKVDSGPGRMELGFLAEARTLGFIIYPGVPNTTAVTQETDQSYGTFKTQFVKNLKILSDARLIGNYNIGLPPLLNHGSDELVQMIAPAVLKGDAISALAITEPSGGSDVANLKTKADLFQKDGVPHYRINGEKVFITSGVRADWLTVAVRTGEPGARGISVLMVPGNAKGLTRSPLKKTGWWMSDTASIYFDNVEVPADYLVGKEGKGFRIIMENFNTERLMLAGACVGFSKVCLNEALDWAQNRQTFGKRLIEHQVIAHKLADMRMKIRATEAWFDETIACIDKGDINEELVADICLLKNQATQTLQHCANEAVQILGGMGFMRGSSTERIYREVKVLCIGGGAEEIMKELAIRQLAW